MITDSEHTSTLYPDGKKHKATDENGDKISTKTEWQGDQLIAEIRTESGKLTDTYQVSSDGKQLIVISRYENSSLSQPLRHPAGVRLGKRDSLAGEMPPPFRPVDVMGGLGPPPLPYARQWHLLWRSMGDGAENGRVCICKPNSSEAVAVWRTSFHPLAPLRNCAVGSRSRHRRLSVDVRDFFRARFWARACFTRFLSPGFKGRPRTPCPEALCDCMAML